MSAAPEIVHRSRGRARLRWSVLRHPDLRLDFLEVWLAGRAGLDAVRVNPAGGCLVAEFAERPGVAEAIVAALSEVPPEAFAGRARDRSGPPRRRLADAIAHLALAAASSLLPEPARRPVALGLGAPVILRGLDTLISQGLRARVLDMATVGFALATGDSPAALGISAMVVVGEYLRQATEDRSNALLRSLLVPPVENVRVRLTGPVAAPGADAVVAAGASADAGVEKVIPFAEVVPGMIVLAAEGETLAVDGVVVSGSGLIDASAITGEAAPIEAAPGVSLPAGCVVSRGAVEIRAVRTGADCATSRIAAVLERSLNGRSRPELLSEKLADRLVPLTLLLGAGLYAASHDTRRALSVLTIDYACAVKLSAPVVIKSSMYAAAKAGILVKSGSALDALARADTLVFDKTGTLTAGRPVVTDIRPQAPFTADELLQLAASAEERWTHPIARALTAEAAARNLPLLAVAATDCATGLGARATLTGEGAACLDIAIGSHRFLADILPGVGFDSSQDAALRSQGKTVVHIAVNGQSAGLIALRDELRPEAARTIAALRRRGLRRILVLTGDTPDTALAVLGELSGLDAVHASLTPDDKSRIITELRNSGAVVATLGDGVNDAPALLASDVGLCLSGPHSLSGLTRDAAGIVLLRDTLSGLVAARDIATRSAKVMRTCFATGASVNSALLVLASAGKLSPLTAAAAHNATTFAILAGAAAIASQPARTRARGERWGG